MCKMPLSILLACMIECGCSSLEQNVAVDNLGSKNVTQFKLRTVSGSFDVEYGTLMGVSTGNAHTPSGQAGFRSKMKIKSNDTCVASWTDASGQKHEAKIDLSKQSGLGFQPDLLFTLQEDGTITVTRLKE